MDRRASTAAPQFAPIRAEDRPELELAAAPLSRQVVLDIAGIRGLRGEYEQLYRSTGNSLPFAMQEWHLAWCEHLLNRQPLISERPLFCVLRAGVAECIAIIPLVLTRRRVGPLQVAKVALLGADPALTEIRNPLVKPGCERLAVRAVQETLAEVPDWDWIQWDRIDDRLADALGRESVPRWYDAVDDCILDLPPSWEAFRAGLPRNVRESLRHCYNSLRREGHGFELVVAREPAEVRRALQRFLELHAMRAAMPSGPRHVDRFAGKASREFLFAVCAAFAARNALRVFQLRIGDVIVASRIGFLAGDSLYLYYSGFDPAWARYSVMTTTVAEAFRYAIANGIRSVNLSLTAEQSKVRWRPRIVRFHSGLVHRKQLRSRIFSAAYRAAVSRRTPPARLLSAIFWPHRNWE